jgi:hypothetical protein
LIRKPTREDLNRRLMLLKHTKEKESTFYAFMAKRLANQLWSSTWYIDSSASRHFTNMQDWFMEYNACSSKDSMIFDGGEEYIVVGKGNVQISFGGKMLIFLNVYYVPSMELNLL